MRKISKIIKIIILISIAFYMIGNLKVYAEENLEEKFKLLDECREEYEKSLMNESGSWRDKKYIYANGYLSGTLDDNKVIQYTSFWGNAGLEYNAYYKMQEYVEDYTEKHFEQYLTTNNENERLNGYFFIRHSIYTREYEYEEYDDIEAKVTMFLVPESNDSKWCENAKKSHIKLYHKKSEEFVEIDGYSISVYVRLVWEDDKYVIKFMDTKPEGYDEYVARMKEHGIDVENIDYASLINAEENVQKEIQEAEKKEFDAKQTVIGNINKVIVAVFGGLIILIILINIFINKKSKRTL